MSVRPLPRVLANNYAKTRADIWLTQKFFNDLLVMLLDREKRNIVQAAQGLREVPSRLKDAKKLILEAAKQYGRLDYISTNPQSEYKDALQRAVNQLSRDRGDTAKERLSAYRALSGGSLGFEGLADLQDELEDAVEKIKNHRMEKKEKEPVAGLSLIKTPQDDAKLEANKAYLIAKDKKLPNPYCTAFFLQAYVDKGGKEQDVIKAAQEAMNEGFASEEKILQTGEADADTMARVKTMIDKAEKLAAN